MEISKLRLIAAYLLFPILFPHLLFYNFSRKKRLIRSDVGGGIKKILCRLVYDRPYRNLFYQRIGRIHFIFSWLLPRCPYTKINQDMIIGPHATLEHAQNTFLNAKSIGSHLVCFHNVTVGQLGDKIPTIGNYVTLSCGASVLGGISIGDNVVIGANCVVVNNVPDNCTVIGNPARIVRMNGEKVNILL